MARGHASSIVLRDRDKLKYGPVKMSHSVKMSHPRCDPDNAIHRCSSMNQRNTTTCIV